MSSISFPSHQKDAHRARSSQLWNARLRTSICVIGAMAILIAFTISLRAANGVGTPGVDLRDANGRRVRLTDFHGKVMLVDLWASWCVPCKVSFPAIDALYREYRDRGVEFIAVNLDERRKEAEAFLRMHPYQLRVVFDPRARLLQALGAPGVPSSYLIDRRGVVRYRHLGPTEDIEALYRQELEALIAEPFQ